MNKLNYLPPTLLCDFYKISHRNQYPEGTEYIYSTWTPRTSRIEGANEVIAFGFQGFIKKYLIEYFNEYFFNQPLEKVVNDYKLVILHTLGEDQCDTTHIENLHKLGYLPLKISAVEEGTFIPIKVPMLTLENTHKDFAWVTNYIETLMSCMLWQPTTSATLSLQYRYILEKYARETDRDNIEAVKFQAHDFSMRGMSSLETCSTSGAGHLLNFLGTDTIPSIIYLQQYYNTELDKELIGSSIPSTEHSVMCAYGEDNEFETYRHLIEDVYPKGTFSVVSDTWNLWNVITNFLPKLKDSIMSREGKVVIRPDSGLPEDILCGNPNGSTDEERKGVIELLWDIFGGTVNSQGYKVLDSHIGAIYGDAITTKRCIDICERLRQKGFASTNIVFGIGGFTYQFNTRDSFGFALKSTYAIINGKEKFLFKNPITDNGVKKSQRGKVCVMKTHSGIKLIDTLDSKNEELYSKNNLIQPIFENGVLLKETSLKEIRDRITQNIG